MTFSEEDLARAEQLGLPAYKRYRISDAAALLGIEYSIVRRMIANGELGVIRVGKRVFVLGGHIAQTKMSNKSAP